MRRSLTGLLVAALLFGCASRPDDAPPAADPASRREPPAGPVVGSVGRYGSHAWRGIPYAAPPVGERRWRAPAPPERWSEPREALSFGAPCPQFTSRFAGVEGEPGEIVGEEDCLFLNVYAPRFAPGDVPRGDARLPVMVWIHGGGNVIGHGSFYDGGRLAAEENVVVVTLNYRLGPLGWFRHAALRGPGTTPLDRSGNFGTLDVIRALEWVRDDIDAFGGDPDNVTIFGESAGGRNVFALLQSPLARGLFHRAIAQSGGLRRSSIAAAENAVDDPVPGDPYGSAETLHALLIADGDAPDRAAAKALAAEKTSEQIAAYLRSKGPEEILRVYEASGAEGLIDVPQVFAEGTVLPVEDPLESFARRDGHAGVPVIAGTNRDEDKLFLFADPENVRRLFWILPRLRDPDRYEARAEAMSRMWKAAGADEPAAALRRGGAPVWVYRFDWDEEPTVLGADLSQMLGAAHGFEIPFVFGHFDLGSEVSAIFTEENEPGRVELARRMMSYWAEFARSGNPGSGGRGDLPPWEAAPRFLVFDTAADGGVRMSDETITEEDALAGVARDPRLRDDAERCAVAREVLERARRVGEADLPPACRTTS